MNRPATIEGIPVITSTKKEIALASRPRPYSTRKIAARIPTGTAKAAASATCSSVPTIAWPAPPPGLRGLTLRIELIRNPQLITFRPLTRTVNSTEISGTTAMTNVE